MRRCGESAEATGSAADGKGIGGVPGSPKALGVFRESFYTCLGRRADALFELADAILTAGGVHSPPHLSLSPIHRRGWGTLYAALSKGNLDEEALRELLVSDLFAEAPAARPALYAVDVSAWPRCDAETSPGRGYYYHPSRHSAGQPIVAGWAYQLIAGLSFGRDSWVAPVDACRVRSEEDANDAASEQILALSGRLGGQRSTHGKAPLFVFDAGYDPVRLQSNLEDCSAQILVRLHSTRTFYADPPTLERRSVGRPFVHGEKFDLKEPKTWHEPSVEHSSENAGYGNVRARAWSGLHPKTRRAKERYGCESAAVIRGTVILVEVERLPRGERRRRPKKLWLWWHGEGEPDLDLLWRSYVRRFDLEHAIKFCKGTLGWTTPRVRRPEQADLWTWLIMAAYTQLRLAHGITADRRLPWEKPLPPPKLTPTRVLRNFASLLPLVGTPASAPTSCGRSPGRPKGSFSGSAKRHPAVKAAA